MRRGPEPDAAGDPRFSLITPSLDQGRYLEDAILSVLEQNLPVEYFVIDGGSRDGSVEIIRRHAARLAGWVSEPDRGQTDAIAKGIARSRGEILNWLNADDLLLPGSLRRVARCFDETGADLVVGEDLHFRESPQEPVARFRPAGYEFPECLRFWTGRFRYHQPCTFFTRSLYERAGGLDPDLHYAMDYDLYCRMLAVPGVRVSYLREPVSAFRLHPDSKTQRKKLGFLREMRAVSARLRKEAALPDRGRNDEMDRYTARCLVHQGAEAARLLSLQSLSAVLGEILRVEPGHAARFATRKLVEKVARRRER